ncbi:MAG TPA: hypothetical protein ENK72_00335 [Epsilonproteobacteria bacterium]|nr:hypothetical protein [Campylobacterota bacterium]
MSKKDALIKEIDEISERVRFWHNIILALVTGISGMLFAVSQEKIILNFTIWIFGIMSIAILFFAINRLETLNRLRKEYIKDLEKEV